MSKYDDMDAGIPLPRRIENMVLSFMAVCAISFLASIGLAICGQPLFALGSLVLAGACIYGSCLALVFSSRPCNSNTAWTSYEQGFIDGIGFFGEDEPKEVPVSNLYVASANVLDIRALRERRNSLRNNN